MSQLYLFQVAAEAGFGELSNEDRERFVAKGVDPGSAVKLSRVDDVVDNVVACDIAQASLAVQARISQEPNNVYCDVLDVKMLAEVDLVAVDAATLHGMVNVPDRIGSRDDTAVDLALSQVQKGVEQNCQTVTDRSAVIAELVADEEAELEAQAKKARDAAEKFAHRIVDQVRDVVEIDRRRTGNRFSDLHLCAEILSRSSPAEKVATAMIRTSKLPYFRELFTSVGIETDEDRGYFIGKIVTPTVVLPDHLAETWNKLAEEAGMPEKKQCADAVEQIGPQGDTCCGGTCESEADTTPLPEPVGAGVNPHSDVPAAEQR